MLAAFFDIQHVASSTEKVKPTFKKTIHTKTPTKRPKKVKPSESKSTHMHVEFVPLPPEMNVPKAANEFDVMPGGEFVARGDDVPPPDEWWFDEADQQQSVHDDDTDSCATFEDEHDDDLVSASKSSQRSGGIDDEVVAPGILQRKTKETHIVYSGPQLCFEDDGNIF